MKKTILFTFLFCVFATGIYATPARDGLQDEKSKTISQNALDGLWAFQGQRMNGRELKRVPLGTFKLILKGEYRTFQVNTTFQYVNIVGEGDFLINSESSLTEKVKKHGNKYVQGKENKMEYKAKDNMLYIRFTVPASNTGEALEVEEVWKRIDFQDAKENYDSLRKET